MRRFDSSVSVYRFECLSFVIIYLRETCDLVTFLLFNGVGDSRIRSVPPRNYRTELYFFHPRSMSSAELDPTETIGLTKSTVTPGDYRCNDEKAQLVKKLSVLDRKRGIRIRKLVVGTCRCVATRRRNFYSSFVIIFICCDSFRSEFSN